MNYYERQLDRLRQSFNRCVKSYEGQPSAQLALILRVKRKVERFRIPRKFTGLISKRKVLENEIYETYLEVSVQKKAGKYGI